MQCVLTLHAGNERNTALQEFYKKWRNDGLVVLKWLALVAGSNVAGNVKAVRSLTKHEAFNIKNPNNCYSLYLGFCRSHPNFHAEDGSGYDFIAESILAVSHREQDVFISTLSASSLSIKGRSMFPDNDM